MPKKFTYEEVKRLIEEKSYELVSDVYINNSSTIEIRCSNNHVYPTTFQSFRQNKGCSVCAGNMKFSFEDVFSYFENNNCILLEKEYVNTRTPMRYICECNEESRITFSKFKDGQRCRKCSYRKTTEKQKKDINEIKLFFLSNGCELISEDYYKNTDPLIFICKCGNESITNWATFKSSKKCSECGFKQIGEKLRKYTLDEVKEYLTGFKYIVTDEVYEGTHQALKCICPNGHDCTVNIKHFVNGTRCKLCHKDANVGENHHNYKSNITLEDREQRRIFSEYTNWRKTIFERDNYTCQICGITGRLHVHHLNGYHWAIEDRVEVENGVTLCEFCHDDFHLAYGNFYNTREQFEEYITGIAWNHSIPLCN
jgi:hypothetical protein